MTDDPKEVYADIFRLPPHRSSCHVPMPLAERAAQFSSFAALSGHDRAIRDQEEKHISHISLVEGYEHFDTENDLSDSPS